MEECVVPQFGIGDDHTLAVGSGQPRVQGEKKELVEQDGPRGNRQAGVGRLVELPRRRTDAAPARPPRAKPDEQWRTHCGLILPHSKAAGWRVS